MEWAEPRLGPGRRGLADVKQRYQLRWNDARTEQPPPGPPAQTQHNLAKLERLQLAEVILSAHDGYSLKASDMFGPSLARLTRAENRVGWELLPPALSRLRWGDASWPISHRSRERGHRVGYLIWHDGNGPCWELAMHHISLKTENRFHTLEYVSPPHAKQAGLPRGWADPAEALAALAKFKHYCPHTALTTLFRLVNEGTSVIEASQAVHIVPSTGRSLVKRARLVREKTGRPLLDQVNDFLCPEESG
jgi:hypothetical protein